MQLLPFNGISRRDVVVVAAATVFGTGIRANFPEPGLDAGWLAGLAMAEERGLIFGQDILFTYGPWGWLDHTVMVTRSQLAFQLLFAFVASAALISTLYALLRARMPFGPAAAITLIPVTVLCHLAAPDERVLATAVAVSLLLIEYRHRITMPYLAGFAAGVLASLFLLVKISSGILVVPLLGLALVVLWRDWRVPLAGLAGLMVGVPILWLLAGQPLAALPAWLQGSMEVASGYSDAMSTYNGGWFNPLLYAAVALAVLALLWRRLRAGEYHRIQAIALALIGLAAVYYGLKLAFVREQELRLVTSFLVLTPVLFFAIPDGLGRARAAATALVAPTAALIVVPQLATVALWPLASPIGQLRALNLIVSEPAFAAERDRQRADNLDEYHLEPDLLAQLQGNRVQIDPHETSLAWTYELDWQPVPVLQLYSAYTPYLDQVNTSALEGPSAPTGVLVSAPFKFGTGDTNPAWVSPQYQLALGCGYRAISSRRQAWTLLERGASSECLPGVELGSVTVVAGQSVSVPSAPDGSLVTMTFAADDAALSKLQGSLLKPLNPLRLRVDDSTYRVPYSLAQTPLLLGCPGGGLGMAQGKCRPANVVSSDTAGTFSFASVVAPAQAAP